MKRGILLLAVFLFCVVEGRSAEALEEKGVLDGATVAGAIELLGDRAPDSLSELQRRIAAASGGKDPEGEIRRITEEALPPAVKEIQDCKAPPEAIAKATASLIGAGLSLEIESNSMVKSKKTARVVLTPPFTGTVTGRVSFSSVPPGGLKVPPIGRISATGKTSTTAKSPFSLPGKAVSDVRLRARADLSWEGIPFTLEAETGLGEKPRSVAKPRSGSKTGGSISVGKFFRSRTGDFTLKEKSPLTRDLEAFAKRFQLDAPKSHNLSNVRFRYFLPKNASREKPGMIVLIPGTDHPQQFEKILPVISRMNFILVGYTFEDLDLDNSEHDVLKAMARALDLAHNMKKIDFNHDRFHLLGTAIGGKLASRLGAVFPEVFPSCYFHYYSAWWLFDDNNPEKGNGLPWRYLCCPEPQGETLAMMRKTGRYVFWTDEYEGDGPRHQSAFLAYRDKGLNAEYLLSLRNNHGHVTPDTLLRGFMFLESALVTPAERARAFEVSSGEKKTCRAVCPGCGGDGRVNWSWCGYCDGTGRYGVKICRVCRGQHHLPWNCDHDGGSARACRDCDGRRDAAPRCRICDGKGHLLQYSAPDVPLFCPDCRSTGYETTDTCVSSNCREGMYYTREGLREESGNGKKESRKRIYCIFCRGDGTSFPACSLCDGTGRRNREKRKGDEKPQAPCLECSGTGFEFRTCKTCNGKSAIWETVAPADEDIGELRFIDGPNAGLSR